MREYSELQKRILDAIPSNGRKISTLQLVGLVYDDPPLTARQSVLDSAKKLIKKVDINAEEFEIFCSKPCGPNPIFFWKEPRKSSSSFDLFTQREMT